MKRYHFSITVAQCKDTLKILPYFLNQRFLGYSEAIAFGWKKHD